MKEVNFNVFVGSAREIKSLYRNLVEKTNYVALFTNAPVFNMQRAYGLRIDEQGYITVLSASDVLAEVVGGF